MCNQEGDDIMRRLFLSLILNLDGLFPPAGKRVSSCSVGTLVEETSK